MAFEFKKVTKKTKTKKVVKNAVKKAAVLYEKASEIAEEDERRMNQRKTSIRRLGGKVIL
tara:strand:- start:863 stop:1042 length:180 start_codon:yes stop_codon:yes gene_type:complete